MPAEAWLDCEVEVELGIGRKARGNSEQEVKDYIVGFTVKRGSNENTNGLLRQYFPRGKNLLHFSQAYLNKIALRLNQRLRKTSGIRNAC